MTESWMYFFVGLAPFVPIWVWIWVTFRRAERAFEKQLKEHNRDTMQHLEELAANINKRTPM